MSRRLKCSRCRVFRGIVEVDETYLGGAWKNKRSAQRSLGTQRGRGTTKTPVLGILCRGGQVKAQVVPDVEAQTLLPLIRKRVQPGAVICSDTWKSYTGIAGNGYVHRLVEHGQGGFVRSGGNLSQVEGIGLYPQYNHEEERLPLALNRPGLAHPAFTVDDIQAAKAAVIAAGGGNVGRIVSVEIPPAGQVTFVYVTDPEENVIELQRWSHQEKEVDGGKG